MFDDGIEELSALVQRAKQAVIFTGAGMSTECGIPDFRSPGGFWIVTPTLALSAAALVWGYEARDLAARFAGRAARSGGACPSRP